MKTSLFVALVGTSLAVNTFADIHDPPANDYGPTRKLGRGLANFLFASSELPDSVCKVNKSEGNIAAASYGFVRGLGRSTARHFTGLYEICTFAAPNNQHNYRPLLLDNTSAIHNRYSEFPPELGNESKYRYCRDY